MRHCQPTLTKIWIPPGRDGTRRTLEEMRNLARKDSITPEVQAAAYMFPAAEVLERWMRDYWAVVDDPPDAEYILSPAFMIRCGFFAGDCDDAATFAASILSAMRIRCQFVAVRVGLDSDFSHVWCRVPGLKVLDIDPIVPPERMPIPYTEAMVMDV